MSLSSLGRIAASLFILAGVASGASPHLAGIDPAGAQRGADTDIVISGNRLQDARGMLFYTPGISVLSMQPDAGGGKVRARLRVAQDCSLGENDVRVWTATGISELLPFYISPFPNVACSGTNHTVAQAQPVPLNSTVNGVIRDEEIDYYSVPARKGDRVTAEVEGMRLGHDMFDPWAAILDDHGRQLAENDDNSLLLQDPLVSIIAPADGTYLVSVRDSAWGGSDRSFYRLHIGNFPQPVVVYPSGGQSRQNLQVAFLGDAGGRIFSNLQLPSAASPVFATAFDRGLFAPTPLQMRVSPFPNVFAQAPDPAHPAAIPAAPVAFNGIIHQPGERDEFVFHAARGSVLDLTVYARQLRSPLDSVLDLSDATGHRIASNDDSIGPDSYLRFNVRADGDYHVSIRDQQGRGGPTFTYRIEVVPVAPEVTFTMPVVVKDTQERQTVVVPRGNRTAAMLRVKRESFDGDFLLNMPGLPPGVTLETGSMAGDLMPVVFQATPDSAAGATLSDVLAQPIDPSMHVGGGYAQTVDLVYGAPNNSTYLTAGIKRLAMAVADEAPFQIDLAPPPAPILQNGQAALEVTAVRKPGFTGPINVSMLYNPPGISSQTVVTIPANQNSAEIPINASGDAKTKTWQVAVIGSGDAGQGAVWTSSGLVPLTVWQPFLAGQLDHANVIQGEPVAITCHLQAIVPFAGKARLRLMGLPAKVTSPDIDIASTDKQAVFNVTTDPASPPGQHHDLFCEVTIDSGGKIMAAKIAAGGVLRIDKAEPKKEVAAK